MALVMPSIPCFVEQYTVRLGPPTKPMSDEILMIEPPLTRLYHPTGDYLFHEICRPKVESHQVIEVFHGYVEVWHRPVRARVLTRISNASKPAIAAVAAPRSVMSSVMDSAVPPSWRMLSATSPISGVVRVAA
jgi:hypothetical protein